MKIIAQTYREAQFIAHAAHNLVEGPTFLQDHEFLAELYKAYADAYDSLIERMIGFGQDVDPLAITLAAAKQADATENLQDPHKIYKTLLQVEDDLQQAISDTNANGGTLGQSNLLQGLFDESEVRVYKLNQLIK